MHHIRRRTTCLPISNPLAVLVGDHKAGERMEDDNIMARKPPDGAIPAQAAQPPFLRVYSSELQGY